MSQPTSLNDLPSDLPRPKDDGAADHLIGMRMPKISLKATNGDLVNVGELADRTAIYAYPMTGVPEVALPEGWNDIPGARGCTPQALAFRDHNAEIVEHGAKVFGLSTQDNDYQRELVDRLRLPFPVLSDNDLELTRALKLPTMEVEGVTLLKRLTMIIKGNVIEHVFYPVFPSSEAAAAVLAWLKQNAS